MHKLSALFSHIFGQFSWKHPIWLNFLYAQEGLFRRRPWLGGLISLMLFCVIAGGVYGYRWYQQLPQPELVIAKVNPPAIQPIPSGDQKLAPQYLLIEFGIPTNNPSPLITNSPVPIESVLTKKSVVPLQKMKSDLNKKITLSPELPGEWKWDTDSRLIFIPNIQWPAGKTFFITFAKDLFAPHVKMASLKTSFTTQAFDIAIKELKFYIDPKDPNIRQIVATLESNYPIDPRSLEDHISLRLQAIKQGKVDLGAQTTKFSIKYDEHKRRAYLTSDNITLNEVPRFMELSIAKGVKPVDGEKTEKTIKQNVVIPDMQSAFNIKESAIQIVRNSEDLPEQILLIETSIGVAPTELQKAVHAYLLPRTSPNSSEYITWENPGQVTSKILESAETIVLEPIPTDQDYPTLHSFRLKAPGNRAAFISIDKGIKSYGNFVLTQNFQTLNPIPEYPDEISFLHKGALMALSSEKKISVRARGIAYIKFEIARVLPDAVNHFVTQTYGDFSSPNFQNFWSFNETNISEITHEIQKLEKKDPGQLQYTTLDLEKYLQTKQTAEKRVGLFLLKAKNWNPEMNRATGSADTTRLILITDMGLLVKDNPDGSRDVFVQSIATGEPLANVMVSILGKNGIPIMSNATDAQGHVAFPTLKDFTEEKEPVVYIASLGSDVSFIPYNRADRFLNYSRFDVGGERSQQNRNTLSAYVFSDRGIYRPGDTVHFGLILKNAYAQAQAAGLPLQASITDPRGNTVYKQNLTSPESGYWTLDYSTDPTSPTGAYNLSLYTVKDKHIANFLGSTNVSVEDFLPDRMRISARLSQSETNGWISPEKLKASIHLVNLFGMPAADRRVTAKILLLPQPLQFKEYPDYTFTDPYLDPKKTPKLITEDLPETRTNAQGEASFDLGLERFDKATYQLIFFAQGFEADGGRGVAGKASALISGLPYLIGYKTDGDLEFIARNSRRSVNLIAIDPALKSIALPTLQAKIVEQRTVASLIKNPDGTYGYQSVVQEVPLTTQTLAFSTKGVEYLLPTETAGNYALIISNDKGTTLSRVKFSIAGSTQQIVQKNAELAVKLNKTEYAPGEDIEMQITAPYTGAGLITIERDKVHTWQWFKTDTTSSVQKIRIPADFQGNGYVNVAFVRNFDSDEIFMSPLSYRVIPFSINRTESTVNIQLGAPEKAQPGKPITFTYSTDTPSKIIVYAVDEGILQVAHYNMPKPLDHFFRKRALEVSTQQIVDQILPKYIQRREISTVGGDAALRALSKNLNPFKRRTDAPVAYWSGIVDADSTPRSLAYNVPDYFNGSLKIMAVAVAPDAVGATSTSSEIKADFVLNPNVPTFVTPGDEFEVSVSVANTREKSAPVTLTLNASEGLEVIGTKKQVITIPNNQEKTTTFKLRARPILGPASLTFTVHTGKYSSHMNSSLSIRPASNYVTSLQSGYSTKTKTVDIVRTLYPEYRQLESAASFSPLILLSGFKAYLDNYPFGCTEQLVSKAFVTFLTTDQAAFNISPDTTHKTLESLIQTLRVRQLSNGEFAYWPGMGANFSTPFVSVYAMHFLTFAKEQKLAFPSDLFEQGIKYLNELSTQTPDSLEAARLQAHAIYLLTRNEIVTTNQLMHLQTWLEENQPKIWKKDLSSAYLAATWHLLKKQDEADRLIGGYVMEKTPINSRFFYNTPEINNAQYIALLADHFPQELENRGAEIIMPLIEALTEKRTNTLDHTDIGFMPFQPPNTLAMAYSALALHRYAKAFPAKQDAQLALYEILTNNKKQRLETTDPMYQRIAFSDSAKKITFETTGEKPYFYQVTQTGFDKNLDTKAIKFGMEISREYRDTKGNAVTEISIGDELEVVIQVRSLSNESIYNVAIIDLLPGGFEIIRDSVKRDAFDYIDLREDRAIFFSTINPELKKIIYKIKATNKGSYAVAPISASAMYSLDKKAQGVSGKILVK